MNTQVKAGGIARVQGRTKPGSFSHGFRAGQLVEVVEVTGNTYDGHTVVNVVGPFGRSDMDNTQRLMQSVSLSALKPAKQAMRKRDEYLNRRG